MDEKDSEILAVIIGRSGSKGVASKNTRLVAGLPMITHTIVDAQQAKHIDHVIVSTDGSDIASAARDMGVEVVDRPADLATDVATVADTVRHAVQVSEKTSQIIVILYANVPVRPDDLIDRAVRTLISSGADSVQSYSDVGKHHPWWMVQLDNEGRVQVESTKPIDRRQDLPPRFLPDGGVVVVTRRSLMAAKDSHPHAFLGNDRRGIISPPSSVLDVDNEIDLAVAEALLERKPHQDTTEALS